jgi:hypothetical protein
MLPDHAGRPFLLDNVCRTSSAMPRHYVSETQLEIELNWSMNSINGRRWFTDINGETTLSATRIANMCVIPPFKGVNSIEPAAKDINSNDLRLWHHRMAHASPKTIMNTAKAVTGMQPRGEIFKM